MGLDQSYLASITIGFNRGRIITFKLRQQIDLDQLYRREFFEVERRAGQEVHLIACKIWGVRNPDNRPTATKRTGTVPSGVILEDDGTRLIRIIGCEFRLSESEILHWLSCFGEVISEKTEEPFESEGLDPELPPIGNGVYNVKMRLKRDLPNWVPMYGRKICLEYPGIRRQCSSCYGPHAKKFCKSLRCGMESFVIGFSKKYPSVPVELYGKLSHLIQPVEQSQIQVNSRGAPVAVSSTSSTTNKPITQKESNNPLPRGADRPVLKISLAKDDDGDWKTVKHAAAKKVRADQVVNSGDKQVQDGQFMISAASGVASIATAAENVSSFLFSALLQLGNLAYTGT